VQAAAQYIACNESAGVQTRLFCACCSKRDARTPEQTVYPALGPVSDARVGAPPVVTAQPVSAATAKPKSTPVFVNRFDVELMTASREVVL
jgi:hypothetical protein